MCNVGQCIQGMVFHSSRVCACNTRALCVECHFQVKSSFNLFKDTEYVNANNRSHLIITYLMYLSSDMFLIYKGTMYCIFLQRSIRKDCTQVEKKNANINLL